MSSAAGPASRGSTDDAAAPGNYFFAGYDKLFMPVAASTAAAASGHFGSASTAAAAAAPVPSAAPAVVLAPSVSIQRFDQKVTADEARALVPFAVWNSEFTVTHYSQKPLDETALRAIIKAVSQVLPDFSEVVNHLNMVNVLSKLHVTEIYSETFTHGFSSS
jgi:hypothetical protein